MLRQQFNEALKTAMLAKDARKLRELESENAKLKKLLQHITRTGGVSEFLCVRRDCLPKVLGKRISS